MAKQKARTITTNPIVTYLEKNYTGGCDIAHVIDFKSEVDSDWGSSHAYITVEYTDGIVNVITLDQTFESFLNTAYALA